LLGITCYPQQYHHAVRRQALFENVSVRFGEGNRYGLIGAERLRQVHLHEILGGDLEQSSGRSALDKGERLES